MNISPIRNSLPKIRKLLRKNYVDIKYILQTSPITYRNSIQGNNLISSTDSYRRLENQSKSRKNIRNLENRNNSEINSIVLQLNVEENDKNKLQHSGFKIKGKISDSRRLYSKQSLSECRNTNFKSVGIKKNKIAESLLSKFEENFTVLGNNQGFIGSKVLKINSSRKLIQKKTDIYKSVE